VINLIVILTSAIMFALLLVWWRWPVFRVWIEAPKYAMLQQEHRFDEQGTDGCCGESRSTPPGASTSALP
jgi:hypothetical protein